MSTSELFTVSIYFILIFISSTSTGIFLITQVESIKNRFIKNPIFYIGISTLFGLGILGNLSLILGFLSKFTGINLLLVIIVLLLISIKRTFQIIKMSYPSLKSAANETFKNPLSLIFIILGFL